MGWKGRITNIVFTQMQDDPPYKTHLPHKNVFNQIQDAPHPS